MKEFFSHLSEKVRIVLKHSDDRMKVFLWAEAVPNPASVIRAELDALLAGHVPPELLHRGVLDDVAQHLARGEKIEERRIAKGEEPTEGHPGRLVFLVKRLVQSSQAGAENEASSLRDLNLFDNIKKGMIVARVYPPKGGVDGKDALGKVIPSKSGPAAVIKHDKSLLLRPPEKDDPYQTLVADADGYLSEESGQLTIKQELVVKGNVDFHIGNLDFIGSILVKGDVLTGFSVHADKNITIHGSVQGGSIHSRHGEVVVKQFVFGGSEGRIVAHGNVSCSTAREAKIECLGTITIGKEAYGCELRTQSAVLSEKARILGGHVFAVCGVEASQFGNDVGLPTMIELCSDIEMTTEYATLAASIMSHRKAMTLLDLHLGPYAQNTSRVTLLKGEVKNRIEGLLKKKGEVDRSLIALLAKQKKLLEEAKVSQKIRLNIQKILYPGVVVRAGGDEFAPKEPIKGPCTIEYVIAEKKFVHGKLEPIEIALTPIAKTAPVPTQNSSKGDT